MQCQASSGCLGPSGSRQGGLGAEVWALDRAVAEECARVQRAAAAEQAGAPQPSPKREDEPYQVGSNPAAERNVVNGLAGFLILGGIVALFVGGPVWEAKNVDSAKDSTGLFGYAPTKTELQQLRQTEE